MKKYYQRNYMSVKNDGQIRPHINSLSQVRFH